jgi:hypothetical protein
MNEDIDAAQPFARCLCDLFATFRSRDIRLNEITFRNVVRPGPRGYQHPRSRGPKRCHGCFANAVGAAGDQRMLACKFVRVAHQ